MQLMRSFIPFILIFLAIFIAACVAYVAWELSADQNSADQKSGTDPTTQNADDPPASR
jgi:flagellar basal body-associated protein FliL